MSKYTTEVRFICETNAGLNESVGADNVDDVINKSWNKIFTTKTEFFDENYRSVLCKKILKHYYLREIGCETVGIWKLWVNTRLEEIMPYYNQLYKSAQIDFNPMHDTDITRTHNRKLDETREDKRNVTGNRDTTTESNGTRNTENSFNGTKRDLYSDTPQGALTGVENETYLTNARKVTDTNSTDGNETTNTSGTDNTTYTENDDTNGNLNSTEDYLETVVGKQGGESFSSLLNKYRETLLNIDMQVIEAFDDLFMGLW